MYGVVLMAALTAATDTPAWGHHGGCHGACYGSYGCCGCCGGCYGNGYGGCYGACYGGWYSCYGCAGGCYGAWGNSCYSGYSCGGCFGGYGGYSGGCFGGYGGYAYGYPSIYAPYPPPAQVVPDRPRDTAPPPRNEGRTQAPAANTAKVVVELPAGAQFYVDDRPTRSAVGARAFRTPALEPGQLYYYDFRARLVENGSSYERTRRVYVRAGEEVRTSFMDLVRAPVAETVAAKRP